MEDFINEKISLDPNKIYKDTVTKEIIPEKVAKKWFTITEQTGLFKKQYKAVREYRGVTYTVLLDPEYVIFKLG